MSKFPRDITHRVLQANTADNVRYVCSVHRGADTAARAARAADRAVARNSRGSMVYHIVQFRTDTGWSNVDAE